MKFLTFFFLVFLGTTNSWTQATDSIACANYKTGNFYVINGTDTCRINRTEDRQKERCGNSETEYQLIVIWLNDRKYILRDIHYNPSTEPKVMRKDVVMKILEIGPDFHTVLAKKKGSPAATFTVYCNKQG